MLLAIERVLAIHPKDGTPNSGRQYTETGCKTISGRSSGWNLRSRLREYEMHLPDNH